MMVYTSPRQAWRQVEKRRLDKGPRVPFDIFRQAHDNALSNVLELSDEYNGNPNVEFVFVDNTGKKEDATLIGRTQVMQKAFQDSPIGPDEAAKITLEEEKIYGTKTLQGTDGVGPQEGPGATQAGPAGPAGAVEVPARQGIGAESAEVRPGAGGGRGPDPAVGRWRPAEAANLIGRQAPGFDQKLQPRDRTRRDENGELPFASRGKGRPGIDQMEFAPAGPNDGFTAFALTGEVVDADIANWSKDEQAEHEALVKREQDAQAQFDFAQRSARGQAARRESMEPRRPRWREEAEQLAPGLMARFRLEFGDPQALVARGRVTQDRLDGTQQAAYDGQERIFYLFDAALQRNTDNTTRINLLHEMGHAHWDTLSAGRQQALARQWHQEVGQGKGPLFKARKLRPGVARGVAADVREWYAERVAWANRSWARGETSRGQHGGLVNGLAAALRRLLQRFQGWVRQLRGDRIDTDFRAWLAEPVAAESAELNFASRDAEPGPAAVPVGYAANGPSRVKTWLRRWFTSAAGLPGGVFELKLQKDGRLAAITRQIEFSLRDLDRAVHDVYGGYRSLTAQDLGTLNAALGGELNLDSLDPRVQQPLNRMRRMIDGFSRRLVREGVIDGPIAARVAGNVDARKNWQMDAGRYAEQKFVAGMAFDPQTWQNVNDHELVFLAERFHELPRYRQSMAWAQMAREYLRSGKVSQALEASHRATGLESRNVAGWEVRVVAEQVNGAELAGLENTMKQAARAMQRYPDLYARFIRAAIGVMRERGQFSRADHEERMLARKFREIGPIWP